MIFTAYHGRERMFKTGEIVCTKIAEARIPEWLDDGAVVGKRGN